MNWNLTSPCSDCPFRSDKVFPLAKGRVKELERGLIGEQKTFACHKTTKFDDDGEPTHASDEEHCAGAMILLEKLKRPNQMMRIAERLRIYDASKLKMIAPVYDSFTEMRRAIESKPT